MKLQRKTSLGILGVLLLCALLITGCAGQTPAEPHEAGVDYDVIVVGGEPEGICAAVSAARNGLKTLLVEDDDVLGGLMTKGMLNFIDMCEANDGTILTQGLFTEFYDAVGGSAFDIPTAEQFFYDWVAEEPNIELKLNTAFAEPVLADGAIEGVVVEEAGERHTYTASRVIDATADADVAAAAGAPYTIAGEDIGERDRHMGVTLVFALSGVDWQEVTDYLEGDGDDSTGATEKTAWGYSEEGFAYVPQDPLMRLRGFNAARQENGDVLVNALILFGVDALSEESKAEGIARAQKELEYILPYVREHFVGFENAELAGTAEQLYVRESRHIVGEYQLTIDDVLENRDQWDKIAIGSYPVDVQPTAAQTYGTVIGNPDRYAVPFRSLVPLSVEDLLVVGRSASYTSLAAGSARVIPLGMAEGEAAGVAAAYSVTHEIGFREMCGDAEAIADVQKTLKKQGAYLEDFDIHADFMDHWAYSGVKVIRALGLLDGGYSNDYKLDDPLGKWRLQNLLNNVMQKTGQTYTPIEASDPPTYGELVGFVAGFAGVEAADYDAQLAALSELGILDAQTRAHIGAADAQPQAAEAVMLAAGLYQYLTGQ